MKQKYEITLNSQEKTITLREFAELDKDILSPLCEETYQVPDIRSAASAGKEALLAALRTKNMYPPGPYAERIAVAVLEMLKSEDRDTSELFFDDLELLSRERGDEEFETDLEADSDDLDELLAEDFEDEYEEKDEIGNLNSSLKVADDEYGDIDEES